MYSEVYYDSYNSSIHMYSDVYYCLLIGQCMYSDMYYELLMGQQ